MNYVRIGLFLSELKERDITPEALPPHLSVKGRISKIIFFRIRMRIYCQEASKILHPDPAASLS